MKLSCKILSGVIFIIIIVSVANILSTSHMLRHIQEERLKNAEVLFAKSLAKRFFRDIAENKSFKLTGVLFEEKKLREDMVEYILAFDGKGYLLSHTYLVKMPKQILKLRNDFDREERYRIQKIANKELFVYDIAVPVMEGIKQVGTIHLGIKGSFIQNIIKTAFTSALTATLIVGVITILLAWIMTSVMVRPLIKLNQVASKIGEGNLDVKIKIESKDEIGNLGVTFNEMVESIKNYRKELISAKSYVDLILSNMDDTLIVFDTKGVIKTVNRAALILLGYRKEELIGKKVKNIFVEVVEAETLFKGLRFKRLLDEGAIRNYKMIYKTKSGEKIPVSFTGSVMRRVNCSNRNNAVDECPEFRGKGVHCGKIMGVIGVARDMRENQILIDNLEETKAELEEFSKTLLAKVEERTKELAQSHEAALNIMEDMQEAKIELENAHIKLKETQEELIQTSKMAAMGQLSSGISHELNQPLTGIKGFAQVALMEIKDNDPLKEDLNKIIELADRMDAIIQNVRLFARKAEFKMQMFEVNEPILSAVSLLRKQLEIRNIKLNISLLGKALPKIQGDPNQLEQVFLNFITNAEDAIDTLADSKDREISLQTSLSKNKKYIEIIFKDTGCGISQDNLKFVFNPFFTTKSPEGGMGLGLSIVYRIIESHKGKIEVESKEGEGAKFTISLPVAEQERKKIKLKKT